MITNDVRDWLSFKLPEFQDNIYNGRLVSTKREKLMSIKRGTTVSQQKAMGGIDYTSYSRLACNCILHWNKNYASTEAKALEIVELLISQEKIVIGNHEVAMLNIRNVVDLGIDENDIYEYAIDFEVIYKRLKG